MPRLVNLTNYFRAEAERHIQVYDDDLEADLLRMHMDLKQGQEDRCYYVMLRRCGSYAFKVRDVFLRNTTANTIWMHYSEPHVGYSDDDVLAYVVRVEKAWGGDLFGRVKQVKYKDTILDVQKNAVDEDPELIPEDPECLVSLDRINFQRMLNERCSEVR